MARGAAGLGGQSSTKYVTEILLHLLSLLRNGKMDEKGKLGKRVGILNEMLSEFQIINSSNNINPHMKFFLKITVYRG